MWTFSLKLGPFVFAFAAARAAKVNAVVEAKVGEKSLRWPQSR